MATILDIAKKPKRAYHVVPTQNTEEAFQVELEIARQDESAMVLPMSQIFVPPQTLREFYDEGEIDALAQSIKAAVQIDPIVVRYVPDGKFGRYMIVDGVRRYFALKQLGRTEMRATVTDLDEANSILWALATNISRRPVTLAEEVAAVGRLHGEYKMSHLKVSQTVGTRNADGSPPSTGRWSSARWAIFKAPAHIKALMAKRPGDAQSVIELLISDKVRKDEAFQNTMYVRATRGMSLSELKTKLAEREAEIERQKNRTIIPAAPVVPMQTTRGTVPAMNYEPQRSSSERTAPELPSSVDNAPSSVDNAPSSVDSARIAQTNAIANELRAISQAPSNAPQVLAESEAKVVDETLSQLDNLFDTLENVRAAYLTSDDKTRAVWRKTLIRTLESALYQAREMDENLSD